MYFGYGMVCFHLNKYCKWCKYVGAVIFIILSIAYWFGVVCNGGGGNSHLLPISFFMSVLAIEPLLKFKWLKVLGQHSIVIYLLNVFIENAVYQKMSHNLFWGHGGGSHGQSLSPYI